MFDKQAHVANEIALALAFADGPDDDAHALREFQFLENLAQPVAFLRVLDLARDAALVTERHEHEVTPRKRDIGGDARAFVGDGALGHLHEHFGADWVNLRDVCRGDFLGLFLAPPAFDFLNTAVQRCRDGIPEMQEGVFFEADVHEHRLEAMLDVLDAAFENAADDVAFGGTFDGVFFKLAIFQQGDAAFEPFAVNDELVAGLASETKHPFDFIDHGSGFLEKGSYWHGG